MVFSIYGFCLQTFKVQCAGFTFTNGLIYHLHIFDNDTEIGYARFGYTIPTYHDDIVEYIFYQIYPRIVEYYKDKDFVKDYDRFYISVTNDNSLDIEELKQLVDISIQIKSVI